MQKILPVVNSKRFRLSHAGQHPGIPGTMSGMDLPLAVMITIPEPWANNDTISQEKT